MSGFVEARLALALLRARAPTLASLAGGHLWLSAAFAAAGSDGPAALDPVLALLILATIAIVLLVGHGGFAADLRSGRALLWLQKPVSAPLHYLLRWLGSTALSLLGVAALVPLTQGVTAPFWSHSPELLRVVPLLLLLATVQATLLFAVSGWGAHPDSLAAALLLAFSLPLALAVRHLGSPWPLDLLVVPWDAITRLAAAGPSPLGGLGPSDLWAVARTLVAWIALGLAGIHVRARSPLSGGSAA